MNSKPYYNFVQILILSFSTAIFVTNTASAESLSEPQIIIEDASSRLKSRLQEPGFVHDFQKITEFVNSVIYPHVDFDLISSLVLGKMWKEATPTEKDSFKKEFQMLLIRTYSRALFELKDWSVRFLPINLENSNNKVMVKTEILQPGQQPISISYAMLNVNGVWKVYDFVIEGVSLVNQYRSSFKNDAERSGSLQEVINQIAKKNSQSQNNPEKT
jgi:phospholipid transport system substrate-binding protein